MPAPEALVLLVGSELTEGRLQDKNGSFLAQELTELGFFVREVRVLPDEPALLREAFSGALATSARLIVSSGGLGHTSDDLTADLWAEALGDKLEISPELLTKLEGRLRQVGRSPLPYLERYARVPQQGEAIPNPVGLAPALWWERSLRVIVALPGPPAELRALWQEAIAPRLLDRFGGRAPLTATLRTTGLSESRVSALLAEWESQLPPFFRLAYNPSWEGVSLHLRAPADTDPALFAREVEAARQLLAPYLYGEGAVSLAEAVLYLCRKQGYTLATAESCTGGHLAATLVEVPGASEIFVGGVVSYANSAKEGLLGVSAATLAEKGAVSEEVALQMAEGVRQRLGATVGVATTGIAGPTGGSPEKPVGTVWIAQVGPGAHRSAHRFTFPGDRQTVIQRSTAAALSLLWKGLRQTWAQPSDG